MINSVHLLHPEKRLHYVRMHSVSPSRVHGAVTVGICAASRNSSDGFSPIRRVEYSWTRHHSELRLKRMQELKLQLALTKQDKATAWTK